MAGDKKQGRRDRIAVVAGLRTPFTKQGTALKALRTVDLGTAVVKELMARSELSPREVTLCVYGQVVPTLDWLNIAREVVLRAGLPRDVDAYSVSRACATSLQALTSAAEEILAGQHDVAVVGGADSMSDVPLGLSRRLAGALVEAQKARSLGARLKAFSGLSPKDLIPPVPGFSREPTTGEQMGEAAEKMAKLNGISRAEQDEIAHRSHVNASRAWADGTYAAEVMAVIPPPYDKPVSKDNLVRDDSTLDAYAKLAPSFDRKHGTITAGNASPLTDGAAALLVMSEARAKSLGVEVLGYVRAFAYAATDPADQLLQGPAYAAPAALDAAGLKLSDIDLVEMHEAFAAQVLSNLQGFESKYWAERAGYHTPVGTVDRARLNVMGGSIAIGHPFGATGARILTTLSNELVRRDCQFGLLTVCAAGGLGHAMVIERS